MFLPVNPVTLMVKIAKLPKDHKNYTPLHLANEFNAIERGIKKYLRKFKWFIPEDNPELSAWKKEI